jgi:hypothetical protein
MEMQRYQEQAARTLPHQGITDPPVELNLILGLLGEAGEVAEIVKKAVYHNHPVDRRKLSGDLRLGGVALNNIAKLQVRYPEGFSAEASLNRK